MQALVGYFSIFCKDWHGLMTSPLRQKNWKILFLLIFLASVAFLTYWIPSPYDESLYRNFAKAFTQHGRPYLELFPDGYFLVFHPYLVVGLNSFWISLTGDSLLGLRLFHLLLWVLPTIWLTGRMAKDLFPGKHIDLWVSLVFCVLLFFQVEAATAELDLPYTFFFLLILWLTRRWHQSFHTSSFFNRPWGWLFFVFLLAPWVKFPCALAVLASICLTTAFLISNPGISWRSVAAALGLACLGSLLSFYLWTLYATSLGAEVQNNLLFVLRGMQGKEAHYASPVGEYSWIKYLLFSAAYISMPLFLFSLAGATKIFRDEKHRQSLMYLLIPLLCIAVPLLASKIRVVRYWDPALPLLVILTAYFFSAVDRPLKVMISIFSFILAFLLLGYLFFHRKELPEIPLGSFSMDAHQALALFLSIAVILIFFVKSKPSLLMAGIGVALASLLATGLGEYIHAYSQRSLASRETSKLEKLLPSFCINDKTLGIYRMRLAYHLPCSFYSLENQKSVSHSTFQAVPRWILPKNAQLLSDDLLKSGFLNQLKDEYSPSPLKGYGIAKHEVWIRKGEKFLSPEATP